MHIFFSSDDLYAPHLAVSIASILSNADAEDEFNFYILEGSISPTNKDVLLKLKAIKDFHIEFIQVNTDDFTECATVSGCRHVTLPTYFRFKIASFKPQLTKALYLDCDIVVKTSLKDLWNADISHHVLAAVEDPVHIFEKTDSQNRTGNRYYFNAGILLLNLQKWRDENLETVCFDYLKNNKDKIKWADQDVLNGVLVNQIRLLSPKWNVQSHIFMQGQYMFSSHEEVVNAINQPHIIHYSTHIKPWLKGAEHPYKHEYDFYRQKVEKLATV